MLHSGRNTLKYINELIDQSYWKLMVTHKVHWNHASEYVKCSGGVLGQFKVGLLEDVVA